jgi:hypothetical protein
MHHLPDSRTLTLTFSLFFASAAAPVFAQAQQPQIEAPSPGDRASMLALEQLKFEFYKELENKKLEMEEKKTWLTTISILSPIGLGLMVLALQLWSTHRLRQRQVSEDFELKAAEIVLQAENPGIARNKALALAALFPARLPSKFAEHFDPKKFIGPTITPKYEVFRAASAKAQTPQEIFRIWHLLFPGDGWVKALVDLPPQDATKELEEV